MLFLSQGFVADLSARSSPGGSHHSILTQQSHDHARFAEEELTKCGPESKQIGKYLAVGHSWRLNHYGWRFINDNMPPASIIDLNKELLLAKKAATEHRKDNGLIERSKPTQIPQIQPIKHQKTKDKRQLDS